MASVGAFLAGTITLLTQRMPGVNVSGPTELPLPADATISPTLIVDQTAGGVTESFAIRECVYSIRCYGATDEDALTVWDLLESALTDHETGEPISNTLVEWTDYRFVPPTIRGLWLYSASLSAAGGPRPDPEASWPVLIATATMRWGHKEVAV
jgi:hypothetical protein